MNAGLATLAAAPGLALGSFLTVVAARLPVGRSILRPRSACGACSSPLAWYDNVPLLSYALLRGRCRSCAARIPLRYPLVEATTALLVVGSLLAYGATATAVLAALFCAVLVAVSVIDLEHRIIPNRIVVPAAAVVLVARTVLDPSPAWAIAALGAAGFFLVAILVYPSGMGMGDVKLALLLGAMLGPTVPVALMIGMIAALVPSLVLVARHGSAARRMALPFAPFLALGGVVALFAGERVLGAYLGAL
ncbi:MAG TPA: prepilin peptidase [Gaiellaceae bacterium]|nr:prepilin peptidase [Gaiellaceae bacterium]